ncbi:RNA polymerase sigma factor [sulfur-oxidizing endosymbiont of Gigantopelta aegis]|uniref:RNA polymerase sigma factor n=1 Tax=sulfur-oxidizing endosymbiont of Gigantopelta aegis TaxID=2794934 RepID=UPI0018DDA1DA|nr:RNA polymerase sigma factor [sulfur-oxidizing endosymbiont of Gigantopelta aegis]
MSILQFCFRNKQLEQRLETCRERLYRIAFAWCHDEMLADDLVQDTLVKALLRLNQLKNPEVLESWAISILNNSWRDYLRRKKEFTDIDELVYCSDETPDYIHERERTINQVRHAVSQLPMGQRQVVALVDLEGMTYNHVSQVLEIPVGTVMSRLNRARKAMLKQLSNDTNIVKLHQQ